MFMLTRGRTRWDVPYKHPQKIQELKESGLACFKNHFPSVLVGVISGLRPVCLRLNQIKSISLSRQMPRNTNDLLGAGQLAQQ